MRNVVVLIKSPPHGKYLASEGLRVATALTLYEMNIFVVGIDDGIYTFLRNVDMSTYEEHISYLMESEIPIMVDEDDIEKRGLSKDDFIDNIMIVPHNKVLDTILKSNITLVF